MRYNNVELSVKVKNKTITEYPHNGQVFIEGRANSNFEIVVTNHNPFDVEAVVSVDGLSVLDGRDAGPQSGGYHLKAGEKLAIPGWKLNESQVAAFQFAGKGGSYAAQSTGSARNTGVIGLLVYKDANYRANAYNYNNWNVLGSPVYAPGIGQIGVGGWNSTSSAVNTVNLGLTSIQNCMATSHSSLDNVMIGASINNTSAGIRGPQGPQGVQGPKGDIGPQGPAGMLGSIQCSAMAAPQNAFDISRAYGMASPGVSATETDLSYVAPQQNLGTAFGECQGFQTQTVSFARGDMQAMIVLYYDDARGLKARGISLARTKKERQQVAPNAFPGLTGCTPPAGWQG